MKITCPTCGRPKYKSYIYCEEHLKERRKKYKSEVKKRYKKLIPRDTPNRYSTDYDYWDINGSSIYC